MITKTNYSKVTMSVLMRDLPKGTMNEVATNLEIPYTTVANCVYGKQYNEAIINELQSLKDAMKATKKAAIK